MSSTSTTWTVDSETTGSVLTSPLTTNITLPSGAKLYLDGGSHVYFHESSNDVVQLAGGVDDDDDVRLFNLTPKSGAGDSNTVYGQDAGSNIDSASTSNSYFGYASGDASHSTAADNTGVGSLTLSSNTTGDSNVAIGKGALYLNTTGTSNVAIGVNSLDLQTVNGYNTAIGHNTLTALDNTTGGEENTINTACGYAAGYVVSTGRLNTFFGGYAGNSVTTGDSNTCIGYNSDASASVDNQIAIGNGAVTDGANKGRWGNSSITTNNIQTDWTVDSDKRIKDNINDSSLGLEFINSLKPKTFTKIHPADYPDSILEARYKSGGSNYDDDKNKIIRDEFDDSRVWDGLVAQDVKEAMDSLGVSFSGWNEESNGKQGVTYSTLVMPLIKAIQELSEKVNKLS